MTVETKGSDRPAAIFKPEVGRIVSAKMLNETEKFFRVVLDHAEPLVHRPGQFIELSIFGVGEAPISICSSPTQADSFELCVRKAGTVTGALHKLEAGDKVGIRGPYGNGFDVEATSGADLLFVAGGLGLAPARSFIKYVLDRRRDYGKVTILYGARNPAERLFTDELAEWEKRPDCDFHTSVDQGEESWKGNVGVVTTLFRHVRLDPKNAYAIVIGPPVMYKYAILEVLSMGIPENRLVCSLERRMKCGVGKCGHCQVSDVYVCKDGPVFSYSEIKRLREGYRMKPKVAFFSFTSCEGCQLMFLNLEDDTLDLLGLVEIVKFREAMREVTAEEYDIAFVEGSITTHSDIERVKDVRKRSKALVAFGACAAIGGINAIKNFQPLEDVRRYVYGEKWEQIDTVATMSLDQVVDVDYTIHGCPVSKKEMLYVITSLVMGVEPRVADYPVCVECKLAENVCVFDKGLVCLGPVTRAGCGAICPGYGNKCIGCRGLISDPNVNAEKDLLAERGLTVSDVLREFRMFDGLSQVAG